MRSRCSTCLGALAIILLGGACANAASPGGQGGPGDVGGDALAADVTAEGADTVAVAAATSAQEKDLLRLREEEKLARDVYLSLRDRWGTSVPVFDNISGSEQTHMDRVATHLTALGIPDPVTDPAVGAFTDPELKALYTQLVASGQPSLVAALTVGATIE
ncbi:MAG: DUF2202 domain-containing protein, partial [Myxococcales bacterium]|nr:DUF2202 domain-containing protein [Myxococcales bacterium]